MPLYDYRCRACGHEFEIQQSISDDALTECPSCKGELRKVFSPVGISFKGSGFYKNDSGSRSSPRSESSQSSAGGSSDGGSSGGGSSDGGSSGASSTSGSGSGSNGGSSGGSRSSTTSGASAS